MPKAHAVIPTKSHTIVSRFFQPQSAFVGYQGGAFGECSVCELAFYGKVFFLRLCVYSELLHTSAQQDDLSNTPVLYVVTGLWLADRLLY